MVIDGGKTGENSISSTQEISPYPTYPFLSNHSLALVLNKEHQASAPRVILTTSHSQHPRTPETPLIAAKPRNDITSLHHTQPYSSGPATSRPVTPTT